VTNHGRALVERIRADHIAYRLPGRRSRVCTLCWHPDPCPPLVMAADIEAGRRDTAGIPVVEVVPWPQVWRGFRWWLPWLALLAAVFGWPGPELITAWLS